jgi:peptidylprolyl isomerase
MTSSEKPHVEIPADRDPPDELEIEEITVGDGEEAVAGRYAEVHYVGVSWATGKEFDSSWDRGKPFEFPLGQRHVIAGWDEGIAGMKVSGRRRLTIPPQLAYGERGAGDAIGPNETLVFVVDLLSVD